MTSIGIIGSGNIGSAFARALARNGIEATIANSRGPDSLADLVRELGPSIKAGTREDAAAKDIVLIAVNWTKLPAALAGLPDWNGRIVIDANNPIEQPLFKPAELNGRTFKRSRLRRSYRRARREGVQPSRRRAARERSRSRRRQARCCSIPVTMRAPKPR